MENESEHENVHMFETEQNELYIDHIYDKYEWKIGETYRIRISHIYDCSKFWVVFFEQELTLFHKYMQHLYNQNYEKYKIPVEKLHKKLYCCAYIYDNFFRALVVDIPPVPVITKRVVILLIDYGQVVFIEVENLFFLHNKLYSVPRFAVRACLDYVQPCDGESWTSKSIERFNELVSEKILLCILDHTDPVNKIVYISIGDVDQHLQVNDIGSTLVNENLAAPMTSKKYRRRRNKKLIPHTRKPFLFPTYEAIENSEMPISSKGFSFIKEWRTNYKLLKIYYTSDESYYL